MATTANDLVEETRAHLYSGQEGEANRLDGAITAGATSILFKYSLGSISRNAVISIDLEDIRIWDVSGQTATVVERGVNGTTAATHADLAYVEVRPKFSKFRVLRAINEDLQDLSSPMNGLFKVGQVDVTFNPSTAAYDLVGVTDIIDILQLRWKQSGPSHQWPLIRKYDLYRAMSASEFTSTFAISLYETAFPGLPIHVRYSTDFVKLINLTDDVLAVSGLPATAHDLPPLGAAIRLVAPREINRNFTENQYDAHRLEEIPPGAVAASTKNLQVLRQQRIISENARLLSDWPKVR